MLPGLVLGELVEVLIGKLGFDDDRVRDAIRLLERLATNSPAPPEQVEAVTDDPDDDLILACAVESGADVLATGDKKHLLPLVEHRGVRLLTPQALLAELRTEAP
jgi:predicted nucleic acid-binding protein